MEAGCTSCSSSALLTLRLIRSSALPWKVASDEWKYRCNMRSLVDKGFFMYSDQRIFEEMLENVPQIWVTKRSRRGSLWMSYHNVKSNSTFIQMGCLKCMRSTPRLYLKTSEICGRGYPLAVFRDITKVFAREYQIRHRQRLGLVQALLNHPGGPETEPEPEVPTHQAALAQPDLRRPEAMGYEVPTHQAALALPDLRRPRPYGDLPRSGVAGSPPAQLPDLRRRRALPDRPRSGVAGICPELPRMPAWTMHNEPSGSVYYNHTATGVSQWKPPVHGWTLHKGMGDTIFYHYEALCHSQWQPPIEGWTLHKDEHGNLFYHHQANGVSQWQPPEDRMDQSQDEPKDEPMEEGPPLAIEDEPQDEPIDPTPPTDGDPELPIPTDLCAHMTYERQVRDARRLANVSLLRDMD